MESQNRTLPIISCERVHDWMKSKKVVPNKFVLLDVSWDPGKKIDYTEKYSRCHIPGAFHFDFQYGTVSNEYFPFNIPESPVNFTTYAQSFGIDSDTHVVVYEAMPSHQQLVSAGRVWWLFRYFGHDKISVMEGGLERWSSLHYPLSSEVPISPDAGNFEAVPRKELKVSYEEMVELVASNRNAPVLLDSRLSKGFTDGHIPTSINVPLASFAAKDLKRLLGKDEIISQLKQCGLDPVDQSAIVSCYAGMTACGLACIAAHVGLWDWRVYIGSWSEWSKRQAQEKP